MALSLLATDGVKVTLMVQFAPTAMLVPQLLVCPKSLGLAPVMAMLLIVTAAPVGFESVSVWDALVVPTCWLLNGTVTGERLT